MSTKPSLPVWHRCNCGSPQLRERVKEGRAGLREASTRSKMAQLALDKNAEEFREAHKARQEVVRQWEGALDLLGNMTHKRKKN